MPIRGQFITFEGIEGSGKSTQAAMLNDWLLANGVSTVLTREPGGTDMGLKIRRIVMDPSNKISSLTELMLFAADRSHHINTMIKPALESGSTVICDRFTDATTAYQGYARGIDISMVEAVNSLVTDGLRPDMTILIDLPVSFGITRAKKRNVQQKISESEGRFEEEKNNFHELVRKGYLDIASKNKDRFTTIDGTGSITGIFSEIICVVGKMLEIK